MVVTNYNPVYMASDEWIDTRVVEFAGAGIGNSTGAGIIAEILVPTNDPIGAWADSINTTLAVVDCPCGWKK